jgi:S-adenosylmethionine:tRNA ribosyltransferase-isomerase
MLIVDRTLAAGPADLCDSVFSKLPSLLEAGDLLVINTTKVRHARLIGTRPSGAPAEVLLIHPSVNDTWIAIGRPGSALRPGKRITLPDGMAVETLEVLPNGERVVRFLGGSAADAMDRFGALPLPPYIDRVPDIEDEIRYQTVYAERPGSVAAPTAGLHFTETLLQQISESDVDIASVDLEVGPGTFKPVEEEDLENHHMHAEQYEIPEDTASKIAATRARGRRVWAVGTTVVRTLESAVQTDGAVRSGQSSTRLMITPDYSFGVVDALITNFHLPRSTLLMLVCAFAGHERTMAAYRHAVNRRYRFYSYGDAMVIV